MRLDVYTENASAIKAYEKAGFTPYMVDMRIGIGKEPHLASEQPLIVYPLPL